MFLYLMKILFSKTYYLYHIDFNLKHVIQLNCNNRSSYKYRSKIDNTTLSIKGIFEVQINYISKNLKNKIQIIDIM
ncbi:hypothetical protein, partial [Plasmodium yoelii yoelii]